MTPSQINTKSLTDINEQTTWEDLINLGKAARSQENEMKWLLGDVAAAMRTAGANHKNCEQMALEIEVGKSTFIERAQVSEYFDAVARATYDKLDYSHFRQARRAHKTDKVAGLRLLDQALKQEWSVDQMRREVKQQQNEPVSEKLQLSQLISLYGDLTMNVTLGLDKLKAEIGVNELQMIGVV